jgi:hypothetical protein
MDLVGTSSGLLLLLLLLIKIVSDCRVLWVRVVFSIKNVEDIVAGATGILVWA